MGAPTAIALIATAALTVFLVLCVLGTMREAALLRGEVKALSDLVRHPPPPSYVGDEAPALLRDRLLELDGSSSRPVLVAFVSPGCQPCEVLVEGLRAAVDSGHLSATDILSVVWAQTSDQAEQFAERVPGTPVADAKGALSRACEVRATPTLLVISPGDHRVTDFNLEGDVQWVLARLTRPVAAVA